VRSVIHELPDFGVKVTESQEDLRLGLARLKLDGAAATTELASADVPVGDNVRAYWTGALKSIHALGGPEPTNLDVFLEALRSRFAGLDGGWRPTIGKNRDFWDIEGLPYISGGGSPSKVPEPAEQPTPTQRGYDTSAPLGAGIRVGIADTPIFPSPALAGHYVDYGTGFDPDGKLGPAAGHATFIAGLVLQRAPRAVLIVQPVLDMAAHRSSWDLATGLMTFLDTDRRVDVLPLAFGTYSRDGRPPLVLTRAMERLAPYTVVLAAAGNHGEEKEPEEVEPGQLSRRTATYPAAIDGVCAVAAAKDYGGTLASFTPPALPWMQLAAPGQNVQSLYLDGNVLLRSTDTEPTPFKGWARWSGSSFAVATVAGEIARRASQGQPAREALNDILAGNAESTGIYPVHAP